MNNAKIISFHGAKGGVGTTVTACIAALRLDQCKTLIIDEARHHDVPAVLGMPQIEHDTFEPVRAGLDLLIVNDPITDDGMYNIRENYDVVIVDAGTADIDKRYDEHYLVTTACYLALRQTIARFVGPRTFDGIVFIHEDGRALRDSDVESSIGVKIVVTLDRTPAIARAVDAGLMASRVPRTPHFDFLPNLGSTDRTSA